MNELKPYVVEIIENAIDVYKRTGISTSKRELAKTLVVLHPDIFKNEEAARSAVRNALHCNGTIKYSGTEDLIREYALMQMPVIELENIEPFVIPSIYKNALLIADLHSLFYSPLARDLAYDYGIKRGCDCVIIDGDFMDFYGLSRFDKTPTTLERFYNEREWGIDNLQLLQRLFKKVFLKEGNHDLRRELYFAKMGLQVDDFKELANYEDYLFFNGSTVDFIEDYRIIHYGKLNIIHGHEMSRGGGVHVAHNRLISAFDNICSAHSHRVQSDTKKTINGEVYGSWSLGCMCNLNARYSPMNEWLNGFAVCQKEENGFFEFENKKIIGNKIFSA